MADLFSHSLSYSKESVQEFFVEPFFQANDLRDLITIRTDIKGTEKLNKVSRPSKITRKKTTAGFNAVGSFALTQQEITVKPVAIEFEQNGRAFLNSVLQQALAKGWKEDDVERMSDPDFWNMIVLPIIAEAGQEDLTRQIFFADPLKETQDGDNFITGTGDVDYDVYTGLWTRFIKDFRTGAIPSGQKIAIANAAVKQEVKQTLSGITAGEIDLLVNNVSYTEAYDTSSTVTATNWFTSHAATIQARGELTGLVVTNPGAGELLFIAQHAGQQFEVVITDAGTNGAFSATGVVANTGHAALGTDEAESTFDDILNNLPTEMLDFNPAFMVSRSVLRNYIATLKNLGTEKAHETTLGGMPVYSFEGFPVVARPEWDKWIKADENSVYPHRVIFAPMANLLFGTDGADDDKDIETWYNQEDQMRRYRVQYKAQTAYLHKELIMAAY